MNVRDTIPAAGRDALHAWRAILDGGAITLFRTHPAQVEAAADLALRLGHPVKDRVYLSLAIEIDGALMTCDAKVAARARAVHSAVKPLSDHGD